MRSVRPRSVPAPTIDYETMFTPGGSPPAFGGNDSGSAIILGFAFSNLVAGSCYGVRFRNNVSITGQTVAYLYDDVAGTLVTSVNGPLNPGAGSFDVLFGAPQALTVYPTGRYTVSVLHPDGNYSYNSTFFPALGAPYTSPSGHLFADFNGSYGPGRFVVSGSAANPTTQTNTYYGAEPLFVAS